MYTDEERGSQDIKKTFDYLVERFGLDRITGRPPIIAVDFDGTLFAQDTFPLIGKKKLFNCTLIKKLSECGMYIILHTCRSGQELTDAVNHCRRNGIRLDAVNCNHPIIAGFADKKIFADVYIDDRAFGVFDETAYVKISDKFL